MARSASLASPPVCGRTRARWRSSHRWPSPARAHRHDAVRGETDPPAMGGGAGALLVARIFLYLPTFEASEALIFVWCVEALADRIPVRPTLALAAIAGVLAGLSALGKFNVRVLFVGLMGAVTIATISRPWWKGLGVYVGVAVLTGLGMSWPDGPAASGSRRLRPRPVPGRSRDIDGAMGTDPAATRVWNFLALVARAPGKKSQIRLGWRSSRNWPGADGSGWPCSGSSSASRCGRPLSLGLRPSCSRP